jgi:hypothetical protein
VGTICFWRDVVWHLIQREHITSQYKFKTREEDNRLAMYESEVETIHRLVMSFQEWRQLAPLSVDQGNGTDLITSLCRSKNRNNPTKRTADRWYSARFLKLFFKLYFP